MGLRRLAKTCRGLDGNVLANSGCICVNWGCSSRRLSHLKAGNAEHGGARARSGGGKSWSREKLRFRSGQSMSPASVPFYIGSSITPCCHPVGSSVTPRSGVLISFWALPNLDIRNNIKHDDDT